MTTITLFSAGQHPRVFASLDAARWRGESPDTLWIDLEAPSDAELAVLETPFRFHPLAIDDCLTQKHQPKIEDFGPYLFLIFRGIDFNSPSESFETIKLGAFLGPNFLVTYHRSPLQSVKTVRDKYGHDAAAAPFRGADYLLYEILDHLIEFYFPVLDRIGEEIDAIEEDLFGACGPETLDRILKTKRRVQEVKRTLAPHRELFGRIGRNEFEEIAPVTLAFYRDLYDSTYRLTEVADSYRDLLAGTFDAYLSIVSHRLNEVMKLLTVFATILMPLTFIVGVYGMNFDYMPELGWRYGYFAVWGIVIAIAASLLWYFRRRRWI
ncbi:MAG: magnesium/cobalt transporter CorA [Gemmatimonadetes bacterium]|nr:magnesium/cobalt transporter CorA [Gemmatimonadota bacterium]